MREANKSLFVEYDNLLELAPGQDKETRHTLSNEKSEELAFPKIFLQNILISVCLRFHKNSFQIVITYFFCPVCVTAKKFKWSELYGHKKDSRSTHGKHAC